MVESMELIENPINYNNSRATYDQAEIQEITGLGQPAAQERFLTKLGIRVFRNASNQVVLEREVFRRWQLGIKMAQVKQEPRLKTING
jgi:hypothetical protein